MSDRPDTEFDKLAAAVQSTLDAAIRPPVTFVLVMRHGPEMTVMGNGDRGEGVDLLALALKNTMLAVSKGPAS